MGKCVECCMSRLDWGDEVLQFLSEATRYILQNDDKKKEKYIFFS